MRIRVRGLNEQGIEAFAANLASIRSGAQTALPHGLLLDDKSTIRWDSDAQVDPGLTFAGRLEFGHYLVEALEPLCARSGIDRDGSLWSWLALAFFEQLCPSDASGARRVYADHRYILSKNWNHHHRHLVRTPWMAAKLHGKHARVVLTGDLSTHGEASEQLMSRIHLATNRPLFEAMSALYVEEAEGTFKLKTGSRAKDSPGSMRRLGKIIRQFDLTYDLRAMTGPTILDLLPAEFDRFKSS